MRALTTGRVRFLDRALRHIETDGHTYNKSLRVSPFAMLFHEWRATVMFRGKGKLSMRPMAFIVAVDVIVCGTMLLPLTLNGDGNDGEKEGGAGTGATVHYLLEHRLQSNGLTPAGSRRDECQAAVTNVGDDKAGCLSPPGSLMFTPAVNTVFSIIVSDIRHA